MSRDRKSEEWLNEFGQFLRAEEAAPPGAISEAISSRVRTALNPPLRGVMGKLLTAHLFAATAVTLVCPQLGVGPILGFHGLHHFFMQFGALPCAAFCGALLLGTSALLSTLFLKKEELRVANRHRVINVSFLVSLSFAGLMLAGGDSDQLSYLFWIIGAVISGWLVMRLGATVRLERTSLNWNM